ncbi:MAG: hypothetical protein ACPL4I_07560 [Bacteroidota bacterium]
MKTRNLNLRSTIVAITFLSLFLSIVRVDDLQAQSRRWYAFIQTYHLRGDPRYRKTGVHNGNRVAITFANDGSIAGLNPGTLRGVWPFPATQDGYIGDVTPLVGIEIPIYRDYTGDGKIDTLHSVEISPGPRRGQGDKVGRDRHFRGFEPLPLFVNDAQDTVAMSHLPSTWPTFWPDHPDWVDPYTRRAVWNGYFGRGVTSADQESFFYMDDNQDDTFAGSPYYFHPDSTDTTRNGMGLLVKVRGLQWAQIQAQDVLFWLYEITNVGTVSYNKVAFGEIVGGCVGDVGLNFVDCQDDLAFFDLNTNLTYTWDSDDKTSDALWVPLNRVLAGVRNNIGYAGYAYLESPGNPFDGIDNDNDATDPSSPHFIQTDFEPRVLSRGPQKDPTSWSSNMIALIDPRTYERKIVKLDTLLKSSSDTATVYSLGQAYKIYDGVKLTETPNNGLDDNLNGIIDENRDLHYEQVFKDRTGVILKTIQRPLAYKNYFTGAGLADFMIDESRQSGPGQIVTSWVPDYSQPRGADGRYAGILRTHWSGDENGDWDPLIDDVGADGVPGTGDLGEGDGKPTAGEPHFDQTDVNESDQIGLTSFNFFNLTQSPDMSNNEILWSRMVPGYFDVIPQLPQDGDFMYASGYFPLPPGHTERFSLALVFGEDMQAIFSNKRVVQQIYDANYNFTRPPDKPHLTAVPGDHKVTLIWDNVAESFVDRSIRDVTKQHTFEGYKIYRSTDPGFTEGGGAAIATFDLKDGIYGIFPARSQELLKLPRFDLGSETGLAHSFVDSGLTNGQTYYYAVTAYTKGDPENNVYPAETPKFVFRNPSGSVTTDVNTAVVIPNAPTAGYVPPGSTPLVRKGTAYGTGSVYLSVLNPRAVKDGHTYEVVFKDTSYVGKSVTGKDSLVLKVTKAYSVVDVTASSNPDTVVRWSTSLVGEGDLFDGVRLTFLNDQLARDITNPNYGWTQGSTNIPPKFDFYMFSAGFVKGVEYPADYIISFYDDVVDTSMAYPRLGLPAQPVKYKVFNVTENRYVKTIFNHQPADSLFKTPQHDFIAFYEPILPGKDTLTWSVTFDGTGSQLNFDFPGSGDTLRLLTKRPFRSGDMFEFTTLGAHVDNELAKSKLDMIKVVPNPYLSAASWEQPLPPTITSGRGERKIDFIHVPYGAKIYIYTARGEHVITLEQNSPIDDGAVSWSLRSKENLDVAYGIYFYVVDAPGVGKKTGKFAIIK